MILHTCTHSGYSARTVLYSPTSPTTDDDERREERATKERRRGDTRARARALVTSSKILRRRKAAVRVAGAIPSNSSSRSIEVHGRRRAPFYPVHSRQRERWTDERTTTVHRRCATLDGEKERETERPCVCVHMYALLSLSFSRARCLLASPLSFPLLLTCFTSLARCPCRGGRCESRIAPRAHTRERITSREISDAEGKYIRDVRETLQEKKKKIITTFEHCQASGRREIAVVHRRSPSEHLTDRSSFSRLVPLLPGEKRRRKQVINLHAIRRYCPLYQIRRVCSFPAFGTRYAPFRFSLYFFLYLHSLSLSLCPSVKICIPRCAMKDAGADARHDTTVTHCERTRTEAPHGAAECRGDERWRLLRCCCCSRPAGFHRAPRV